MFTHEAGEVAVVLVSGNVKIQVGHMRGVLQVKQHDPNRGALQSPGPNKPH